MIIGIGVDIVKNSRLEKWLDNDKILERFFNPLEVDYVKACKASGLEHLAARFAAKEAFVKALGTGFKGIECRDICVKNEASGKPMLFLENSALNKLKEKDVSATHLSISHEKEYTVAFVVLEKP